MSAVSAPKLQRFGSLAYAGVAGQALAHAQRINVARILKLVVGAGLDNLGNTRRHGLRASAYAAVVHDGAAVWQQRTKRGVVSIKNTVSA